MTLLSSRYSLLALALLPLATAEAAYKPAVVGADARWVIYADFNALRGSTLGKELITAVSAAQTHATGGFIGIDVPKVLATVGSVTAYGTNLSSDPNAVDGTLVVEGTAELRKIVESVLLQGTLAQPEVFSEATDLPFPAYAISDPKAPAATKTQLVVAFPPEPIVLVSKSKAQLLKGRDVFRGAAPSLAKTPTSPLARMTVKADGAYLFASSVVPAEPIFPQNSPQSRMLQLASSGSLAFGEQGGNTFAHAELVASSDANAEKLMKILQGMMALVSFAETNDKQLEEFLHSTAVTREKDAVTLRLAYSSDRLVHMMHALRAQAEARPANRPVTITNGKVIAEWGGEAAAAAPGTPPAAETASRTIDSVALINGNIISLGRAMNGGRNARFNSLEVTPADGTGRMVFGKEFFRQVRGSMWEIRFPGADGTYSFKVNYTPDPDGKAKFAVSVRNPNEPQPPREPAKGPVIPEPKWK